MPRKQWTYIITDADCLAKIGKSTSPLSRFSKHQTSYPKPLLLFAVHDDDVEKQTQALFEEKRLNGEWFQLCEDDLTDLIYEHGFDFAEDRMDELKAVKHYHQNIYPEYEALLQLYNDEFNGYVYITELVKVANERGMRTPNGFVWTPTFARFVFKVLLNNGYKIEHFFKIC